MFIGLLDEKVGRKEKMAPYLRDLPLIKSFESPESFNEENIQNTLDCTSLICLHDSFFNKLPGGENLKMIIKNYSEANKKHFVLFGGGISRCVGINDHHWIITVDRFYENLKAFYENLYIKNQIDLSFLAFGRFKKVERAMALRARLTYQIHDLKLNEKVSLNPSAMRELENFSELISDKNLLDKVKKGEVIKSEYTNWLNVKIKSLLYEEESDN